MGGEVGRFRSILFQPAAAGDGLDDPIEPAYFSDLNLDQILAALTAGHEEYDLAPYFYAPLRDVESVGYRHEVLRDLEREATADAIDGFARRMRSMREHLAQSERTHYRYQKQRWFLDAVDVYCGAVASLRDDLDASTVSSRGLRGLRDHLTDYTNGSGFRGLVDETRGLLAALSEIRYSILIRGVRVTVSRYEGEADYTADVEQSFAKFRHGGSADHLVRFSSSPDMNHVEAQVLDRVARLYPDTFRGLDDFCTRHRDYLEATIGRFDREMQFYLAYLELIEPLEKVGLPFCYPELSDDTTAARVEEGFDLALANKLVPDKIEVVRNDFQIRPPERILVVTGPNQGGKTTFARMVGQLHHLASLGYPVPARSARLFLPDRLFTHFEREEDLANLRGKLDDELVRVHGILAQATDRSVVVMNESFSSTTLNDAQFIGTRVLRRLLEIGPMAVYVTFVDELSALDDATVSLVAEVVPDNPAQRTYEIARRPADGLAYADALARKYGLTDDMLDGRISR